MWKAIAFYLMSGFIVESLITDPVEGPLEVLMRTVMAFTSISILLLVKKKWQYFGQLFTAIFICENFIMTLAMGVEALDLILVKQHYEYREEVSLGLGIFLAVWYVGIVGYILRQMFSFKMSASLMAAFGYFVLTYGIPMMFMDM